MMFVVSLHPLPWIGKHLHLRRMHCFITSLLLSSSGVTETSTFLHVAVAGTDVLRRLATYVVSRPAREVLFTVVSREEKYKAKVTSLTYMLM